MKKEKAIYQGVTPSSKVTAESKFRAALARIIDGSALNVERNAQITQNNVAREAGVDPSALRASRYPALVMEIRDLAGMARADVGSMGHKPHRPRSEERRNEKQRYQDMKRQRDHAAALLASADSEVLRLMLRVRDLERHIEETSPGMVRPQVTMLRVPKR
ncbi:hypothetical protein JY423_02140 [Stenotrophomonas maltophilia]|uniref:Uncharacterized protein n=1 Tax=Knufia peltigerae TaxID=1002370 RepID=A0AA38Y0J8_9EURO|nr:hypothetical protein H2204_008147 [Knufia peltigerae]MBH1494018.1 hypothetical protein [Stenotrophomonas maltophilia]MBN4961059.1 hypothetical protein [Stenotrophomonas maltophilia]